MKSETQLQATCFQWAWNERPQTRRLLCYNLNNSKNKIAGNQNKALGLIKGRADMELLWNGRLHYIEFKFGKGRQGSDQVKFQDAVEAHGATYTIVDSFEQFKTLLCTITNS